MVADWRTSEEDSWDEKALNVLLTEQEFVAIKNCTLAESSQDDFLSWKYKKIGEFTVRSAYHYEMQSKYGTIGSSDLENHRWLWNNIWKAEAPAKVKNLVRRAISNGLPTMVNLADRGINVHRLCPRCGEGYETVLHMMLSCRESTILWRLSPIRLELNDWPPDLFEWCYTFARSCLIKKSWESTMMFMWKVWCMRNIWVFEKKKVDPVLACQRTMNYLGEFEMAAIREDAPKPAAIQMIQKWQPPERSLDKLNTDATMNAEEKVGLGMVIRNDVGDVLISAGRTICGIIPAIQAEAEAVLFGLKYAYEAGLRSLEVETDCLNFADLLQSRARMRTPTQVIVNDIFDIARSFDICCFRFASRKCNNVAHNLAKKGIHLDDTVVWLENCHVDVLSLVLKDKAFLE